MSKTSFIKFSIIGFILMTASAVTAAIMPDGKDKKGANLAPGSLTDTSSIDGMRAVSSITCAPDSDLAISDCACTASTKNGSLTTGGPGGSELTSENEHDEGPDGPANTTDCNK
jgi:hypothetical protein